MIPEQEKQVLQMVGEGRTIVQICENLDLEWKDVAQYLYSVDKTSWLGAKRIISKRLKSLEKQNDASARIKLAEEADKWVDYLYYSAKRLGDKVEKTRRYADRLSKTLDG